MSNDLSPQISGGPPSGEQQIYSAGSREKERATPRGDAGRSERLAAECGAPEEGMEDTTYRPREGDNELADRTREQAESALREH